MAENSHVMGKIDSPDFSQILVDRVRRLERMNRILVIGMSILGAIVLLAVTLGASPPHQNSSVMDNVKTKSVEIVDNAGRTRALLNTGSDGGPCLALLDEAGIVRGRFYLYQDINSAEIPRLVLYDEMGRTREMVGVSMDGSAVKLFDLDGNIRAIMGLSTDNNGGLVLMDKDGHARAAMGTKPDGTPSFDLFNEMNQRLFSAP
jgi:hypothetical protein